MEVAEQIHQPNTETRGACGQRWTGVCSPSSATVCFGVHPGERERRLPVPSGGRWLPRCCLCLRAKQQSTEAPGGGIIVLPTGDSIVAVGNFNSHLGNECHLEWHARAFSEAKLRSGRGMEKDYGLALKGFWHLRRGKQRSGLQFFFLLLLRGQDPNAQLMEYIFFLKKLSIKKRACTFN